MPNEAQRRAQQMKQQEEQRKIEQIADAMAKRRATKPTDKQMPEGIEDLIVGNGVQEYRRIQAIERKLDAMMMRKRLDLSDIRHNVAKRYKRMRVWISNTVENQMWQGGGLDTEAYDFSTTTDGVYRMRVEGRLFPDSDGEDSDDSDEDEETAGAKKAKDGDAMDEDRPPKSTVKTISGQTRTRFSHFFSRITVELDQPRGNEVTMQADWKKPTIPPNAVTLPAQADFDSIELERKIDETTNCTVTLWRDENPERFQLSDALAEILDSREEDRRTVIVGIWDYVKAMNLQHDEEKRVITCDDRLRKVKSFLK